MNISYKFSPNGGRNEYVLTVDGAEIGWVKDKEYAEAIEAAQFNIATLENAVNKLTRENDELTATVHHLRAK